MRIYILPDFFSGLKNWFVKNEAPQGMPAVHNFLKILGSKKEISFDGVLYNKYITRTMHFENGSKLELKKITLFKSTHLLWKLFAYTNTFFYSIRYLSNHRFELVYGMSVFANYSMLLGKIYKIKSVGRLFGTLSSDMIKSKQYFKLYFRNFLDVMAIKFPCDVMISTEDGTEYKFFANEMNPSKEIKLMFNGIDKSLKHKLLSYDSLQKKINPKNIKICYVGRLSYWKRQDLALDVLFSLRQKGIDASMTIIGDGPDLKKIKSQISELMLSDHVEIINGIPQMELPEIINKHDISMFLYDNGNLGNALWEACLGGQIICVKNSGDLNNIFQNNVNSILVQSNDSAEEISLKMINSLENYNTVEFGSMIKQKVNEIIIDWEQRINDEISYILSR